MTSTEGDGGRSRNALHSRRSRGTSSRCLLFREADLHHSLVISWFPTAAGAGERTAAVSMASTPRMNSAKSWPNATEFNWVGVAGRRAGQPSLTDQGSGSRHRARPRRLAQELGTESGPEAREPPGPRTKLATGRLKIRRGKRKASRKMFSYTEQGVHGPGDSNLLDGQGAPLRELLIDELAHRVEAHLELARMHGHDASIPGPAALRHSILLTRSHSPGPRGREETGQSFQ